jgi:hypothetical protein
VAPRAARTSRGTWRWFVTIVLSALAVLSVLDVVVLVRADGVRLATLVWLGLPVALSVAARRAWRLPGNEARVG